MITADQYIENKLSERRSAGNYRALRPENALIDFCSNDYLGFAKSKVLHDAIDRELLEYSSFLTGATGSRLISGNLSYTESLEKVIAGYHLADAGLIFNSGYDANVGLLSSLPQRGDTIITDELIHASLIDGARLSHANRYTFQHNNLASLAAKLKQARGVCYVVVESIYSMDGDSAPLTEILKLTEQYHAHLIVDEAHAVGLYQNGLVNKHGLADSVFARVVTFGKALGCHGAIILGSNLLREYLINFARSFIYTTAAPFHQLASVKMAYQQLTESDYEIESLRKNIDLFKDSVNNPVGLLHSDSAIQCIISGSSESAKALAAQLQVNGIDVRPILSPTVKQGSERIRICIHSYNTQDQISNLTEIINDFSNG